MITNKRHFVIFWTTADNDAWAKWKKVIGKPEKIMELILKTNTDLKANLLTYNSHPSIMISFNWLIIIWKWGRGSMFEIGCSRSRGWKNFGRRWTREWGVIKIGQFSWTSYVLHPLTAAMIDVGTFLIWLIELRLNLRLNAVL